MARRPTPSAQAAAAPGKQITVLEMHRGIERLRDRIRDIQSFNPGTMTVNHPPELSALEASIKGTLEKIFGDDTASYRRYSDAAILQWDAAVRFPGYPTLPDYRDGVQTQILKSVALLDQAITFLEEEIADAPESTELEITQPARVPVDLSKIFVVHGHDEGAREAVARFIKALEFQPIILHERANEGRTVIEKVEVHGDVGFAVVLLTPDDEGCAKGGTPGPRARQNVVLELGYFIGRLGRNRVCALKRGEVEIPSDFGGVVYETFDASGGWKQALGRELEAVGFAIDWNKVMRS